MYETGLQDQSSDWKLSTWVPTGSVKDILIGE